MKTYICICALFPQTTNFIIILTDSIRKGQTKMLACFEKVKNIVAEENKIRAPHAGANVRL